MTTHLSPTWTLGERIRKARVTAGLTQQELADLLEIRPRTLSLYELDTHRPRRLTVIAIATVTGVGLDWLEGQAS